MHPVVVSGLAAFATFAAKCLRNVVPVIRVQRALASTLIAGMFLLPAIAEAAFTVTPITWNVIGLDSNRPVTGPKNFPVGARVCSNVAASNIGVTWAWTSANTYINLRPGSLGNITIPSLAAGACADAYFEVEVTPVAAAFDTTRRYAIVANDGVNVASSPVPRELYVEHLVSQSRNAVTDIKLNGVSIPPGGAMNLVVGNTYTIELDGGTATQGYNQLEAFINIPNTIFQILSVATTYSADNSPYVPGPFPLVNDKLYADACLWDSNPASPNYRSCIGGDFKAGGNDVRTIYTVRIISGGGTSQTINSLFYDFSGSSYHYNADYGVGARIANIIDPATLAFSKAFVPTPGVAGGTSTLTFTITNPNAGAVDGVGFTDPLPLLSGSQMVVATPATFSTSGCGAATFAPAAGAPTVALSNATVPANGSCVVNVKVFIPSTPTTGAYANVSGNLLVGSLDTGKNATASLTLASFAPPTITCGLVLAQWTMPPAAGTTVPPAFSSKAANVAAAAAVTGAGLNGSAISTTIGNPVNAWGAHGWSNSATLSTADNDYFEFAATTSGYTNITFSFDAQRSGSPSGPASLQLYYSTDGTTFTAYGGILSAGTTFSTFSPALTGAANTGGLTYFRIYGFNAANSGTNALLFVDNITIGGCQSPLQPTLSKAFLSNPVAVGGTSTLQFTLTNPNTSVLTGAKFTDDLPGGLQVAASPNASTTCGGSPTWAPAAGATSLSFGQTTGATLAAAGSCTVSVDVSATTAGPHTNVSGFLSTSESGTNSGNTGSATASLTAVLPPVISKDFSASPIVANGTSQMTFTITNPNVSDPLSGITFADTYPAGLTNINPLSPPVANTCGGTVTASAGGNALNLAGGALAAGARCSITVIVTAPLAGNYVNSTNNVSAAIAGSGNADSATLTVTSPSPAIDVLKQVGTSATGPWFAFVTVPPGTPLHYRFTVENVGDVALSPFVVTDATLAGTSADPVACAWQTPNMPSTLPVLPVATATIDPTATCVVGPVSAALGGTVNTAIAHGTYVGVVYDSGPGRAEYVGAPPGFSLTKQVGTAATGPWSPAINVAVGSDVYYRFVVVNTGNFPLTLINVTDPLVNASGCLFTDPLPVSGATVCAVGPVVASGSANSTTTNTAIAHGTAGATIYDTAPSSASYTIGAGSADLAVTKTIDNPAPVIGTTVTFTITLSNNGPSAAASVVVSDPLPAGYALLSAAPSVGSYSAGVWTVGALANGASATLLITATVNASGPYGNTATASAATPDPNPGNNSSTVTPAVVPPAPTTADLAITKSNGVSSVTAGATVSYAIVASNAGPSPVVAAVVADALPVLLAGATWTCSGTGGGTCPASGIGSINAPVNLPVGATVTFMLTATVSPSATGTLVNTATITPPAGITESNPGNNTATDSDPIVAQVALAVVKTDGSATYTPGGNAVYAITITNTGPSAATSVTVADALPAGVTLSANAGCVSAGNATCGTVTGLLGQSAFGTTGATLGAAPGDSLTFTVPVAFAPGMTTTPLVNQATASDIASGASAQGTDSNAIAPQVSLSVVKTDGSATYTPGGTATYTVTINNGGVSSALNITVSDTLPPGVALTGAVTCMANGSTGCGTVTGTTGQTSFGATGAYINAGAGNSLVYTVPVAFAGALPTDPVNNTATATDLASSATGSGTDSNTRAAAVTLVVTKTDGSATYTPGGSATYTVTVTNTGVSDALDIVVTDTLPMGVTIASNASCVASGIALCGTITGTTGQVSFGTTGAALAAGMGNALTFSVPVNFSVTLADNPLVNAATARDNQSGATATGSDSNALALLAGLAVSKSDGSATYTPGGAATYAVVVTNAGPSNALNVTVTDPLPAGVTLAANATCVATGSATCGTVTGTTGQAAFGTTGASIAAGAGNSLTLTAPVAFGAGLTTDPLVNTVTANDPANPAPVTATDSNVRSTQVSLAVVKTDGSATYSPGGAATYMVTVTNGGLTDAVNVAIADTLPAGVTLNAAVTCVGNGGATCGTISGGAGQSSFSATGAQIPAGPGRSLVYSLPVTFAPGLLTDPLVNTAAATDLATGANASGSDNNARAAPLADLSIAKTNGLSSVTPGSTITYTIVVANGGPAAVTGANVSDTPPATLSGVSWACTASAGSNCPAAGTGAINVAVDLLAGGTATFAMTGVLSAAATGVLTNTATVSAPAGVIDSNPGNNTATDTDPVVVIVIAADLAITKSNGRSTVTAGSVVSYTIMVTNNGPSAVVGATVADAVPALLTGVSWSCVGSAGSSCPAAGTGSIAVLVNLLAGGNATFTVAGTLAATATGTLTNTATVTPPTGTTDPNPANNVATDVDPIVAVLIDLAIVKRSVGTFYQGQVGAQYSIEVSNVGAFPNSGTVTVTEVVPTGLTATSIAGSGWTCTPPAGPCTRADPLAPGMRYPVLTLTVDVSPFAASPITNTVNLAGGGDTNGANNSSQDVVALASGVPAEAIPVDSRLMLFLLASLLAVMGAWRTRSRRRA